MMVTPVTHEPAVHHRRGRLTDPVFERPADRPTP
jgi:hypothetical protein